MIVRDLASWRASNGLRAAAFVALAVALTLAIQLALHHRGGGAAGRPEHRRPGRRAGRDVERGRAGPRLRDRPGRAGRRGAGVGRDRRGDGAAAGGGLPRPIAEYRAYARATAATLAARSAALERALRVR